MQKTPNTYPPILSHEKQKKYLLELIKYLLFNKKTHNFIETISAILSHEKC